jgi:hypothetical protein
VVADARFAERNRLSGIKARATFKAPCPKRKPRKQPNVWQEIKKVWEELE